MVSTQDALRENEIDDEEEQDTGVGEDVGGDGDLCIVWVIRPDDTHDVGADTGHGEAEQESGEDEFVAAATVALEDGHVEGGGGDEEHEEDG